MELIVISYRKLNDEFYQILAEKKLPTNAKKAGAGGEPRGQQRRDQSRSAESAAARGARRRPLRARRAGGPRALDLRAATAALRSARSHALFSLAARNPGAGGG